MARPKRPSQASSLASSLPSLPGIALTLFAAVAAGFFASRAFKKRSQLRARSPHSRLAAPAPNFPDLLKSLPNSSPTKTFQDDNPVVQVVVSQEIVRGEDEVPKIEEDPFSMAELQAVVAVEGDDAIDTKCSPRVNGIDTGALKCNLEVQAATDEDIVTREFVVKSPDIIEETPGIGVAEALAENTPVGADFNDGEEAGRHAEETVTVVQNSVETNTDRIHTMPGNSEEINKGKPEQSPVLVKVKPAKSFSEVHFEEDHDGSTLSDYTGCAFDSKGSFQEVPSAAVKPPDPCLEEGKDAEARSRCVVINSGELNPSTKESDEQATSGGAEEIKSIKKFLWKVDCNVNPDGNGGFALVSPNLKVTFELPGKKQSYSIDRERFQGLVGSVPAHCEVVCVPSETTLSGLELSVTSAFDEVKELPQRTLIAIHDESEEKIAAENQQDSDEKVLIKEEKGVAHSESVAARVVQLRESGGGFDSEENLQEIDVLERNSINGGNLPLEEELASCSSSEDSDLRLFTESADREQENTTDIENTKKSIVSSDDVDTVEHSLSSNSVIQQNVLASEELQLDPQSVLSKTKASEKKEIQQTEKTFKSKKFDIEDLHLKDAFQCCTELSGDLILASTTDKQLLSSTEISTVNLQKGVLTSITVHISTEMTLIGVLIGLLSLVLWVMKSLSIHETVGVTAQN